ncbi:CEGP1 protein [Carpediemonas membranifera]|uniref:CEGP1 protein n=1 Tax=Carpediemonas membranifera TaxID=201153 RepID=A0A8J6EBK0_9EUKA|nr:CEGP1 protein [Carpediemonas membranifera]|eukprot:KAG9397435.1 CEGP1 protein [Carpediemonas membranifera]
MRALSVLFLLLLASFSLQASTATRSWTGNYHVPDGSSSGAYFDFVAPSGITGLEQVTVQFHTTYASDVIIKVVSPSGSTSTLRSRSGGSADILSTTVFCYSDDDSTCLEPYGSSLGSLGSSSGTWHVFFEDAASQDDLYVTNIVLTFAVELLCDPGYYRNDGLCIPAPAGYYADGSDSYPCNDGHYQPSSGQSSCLVAAAGYYVPADGQPHTSATPCAAGYFAKYSGLSSCTATPAGFYSPGTTSGPLPCNSGKYQPDTAATSCLTCPAETSTPSGTQGYSECFATMPHDAVISPSQSLLVNPWVAGASGVTSASITTEHGSINCWVKPLTAYSTTAVALVPVIDSEDSLVDLAGTHNVTVNLNNGDVITQPVTIIPSLGTTQLSLQWLSLNAKTDGSVCLSSKPVGTSIASLSSVEASATTGACVYSSTTVSTDYIKDTLNVHLDTEFAYDDSYACFVLDGADFASSSFRVTISSGSWSTAREWTVYSFVRSDGNLCFRVPDPTNSVNTDSTVGYVAYDTNTVSRYMKLYTANDATLVTSEELYISYEDDYYDDGSYLLFYFVYGFSVAVFWGCCLCGPCLLVICAVCLPTTIIGCCCTGFGFCRNKHVKRLSPIQRKKKQANVRPTTYLPSQSLYPAYPSYPQGLMVAPGPASYPGQLPPIPVPQYPAYSQN